MPKYHVLTVDAKIKDEDVTIETMKHTRVSGETPDEATELFLKVYPAWRVLMIFPVTEADDCFAISYPGGPEALFDKWKKAGEPDVPRGKDGKPLEIPFECHNRRKIDVDKAWRATRFMCESYR